MAETLQKINVIKNLSLDHGLKVLQYDSFDKELEQANQLILKLEKLNVQLIKKAAAAKDLVRSLDASVLEKDQISEALVGMDQNALKYFQAIEGTLKNFPSFEVDPEDSNKVRLSGYLEKALEMRGVEIQDFYQILEKNFNAKFEVLQIAFSKNPEGVFMLK
ncbi:hypothetical protein L0F63_004680, partial [Massospora cicadina]